jgi:predicted nucleic-acid-binding Zn-ribbon protein
MLNSGDNSQEGKQSVCPFCASDNAFLKQVIGKGLPPKNYIKPMFDFRRVSWEGIWDVITCKDCGKVDRKLRR